jgi:uncharacterized damage-inducible protein DinB
MSKKSPFNAVTRNSSPPEPWLRGTQTEVPAIPRAVLHALELAHEDLHKWCGDLTDADLNLRLANLPPVAFHLCHIARSLDRLLTYAEGRTLSEDQRTKLKNEMETGATRDSLFAELTAALKTSSERVRTLATTNLEQSRTVGARALPTSLGGLLVHVADHTQRHVGQAITTAKIILAQRA